MFKYDNDLNQLNNFRSPYRSGQRTARRQCPNKCGSAIGHLHHSRLLGQRRSPRRPSRSNLRQRTFHRWPDNRRRSFESPGCRLHMWGLFTSHTRDCENVSYGTFTDLRVSVSLTTLLRHSRSDKIGGTQTLPETTVYWTLGAEVNTTSDLT